MVEIVMMNIHYGVCRARCCWRKLETSHRTLRLQIITPPPQKKDMAFCTSITDSKREEDKANANNQRMRVRNDI
jgi:hypothetical protein